MVALNTPILKLLRGTVLLLPLLARPSTVTPSLSDDAVAPRQPSASAPSTELVITSANFGLVVDRGAGGITLVPALDIAAKAGTRFGWLVTLRPVTERIAWRSELIGPATATSAIDGSNIQTSEGVVEPGTKSVADAWEMTSSDLPGVYTVNVYMSGKRIAHVQFTAH